MNNKYFDRPFNMEDFNTLSFEEQEKEIHNILDEIFQDLPLEKQEEMIQSYNEQTYKVLKNSDSLNAGILESDSNEIKESKRITNFNEFLKNVPEWRIATIEN